MRNNVFLLLLFFLFGLIVNIIRYWPDGRLHIFFCDVGQGDAIYIRFPNNSDMLIDGGPRNRRVFDCLSRAMPFYDRYIDVVMLTHPQADHFGGLSEVIKRYDLGYFVTPPVGNQIDSFFYLLHSLQEKQAVVKNLYSGAKMRFGQVSVDIIWPDREWVISQVRSLKCKMQNQICIVSVDGTSFVADAGVVLGASVDEDLNYFSMVAHLSFGSFDALFTGDADSVVQQTMFEQGVALAATNADPIEVFKVPHHGSRTGILETFLDAVLPKLAVITVGKNNRYGHPAPEILDRLKKRDIRTLRTDENGTIEVIVDGQKWEVR